MSPISELRSLSAGLGLALALACAAPAQNPIANSDFENGAAGWSLTNALVSPDAPHTGKACLRLDRNARGGAIALQFITLPPETWYVCEFYYKIEGTPGLTQFRFMGDLVDGKRGMPSQIYYFDRCERKEWTRGVNHVYSGQGGRCELEIRLGIAPNAGEETLPPSATLWLDDIALRPMTLQDTKGELIENGDFESGNPGFMPPGWSRRDVRAPGRPTVSITGKESHTGKQALQIQMGPPQPTKEGAVFVAASGQRRVPPGRPYTLSFWAKASRKAGCRVVLSGPTSISQTIELTPDWQRFTQDVFLTPEQQSASKGGPGFGLQVLGPLSTGGLTYWFDDFSLRWDGE
ncbi:MAG TPA: hypothetical protein P5137_15305 [Candidatus Brocadiia bacterium]|nr:hypothetical protein [Candidatus Brocadiia bacterium]